MTDREKVMTWLEICGENDGCSDDCPYGDEGATFNCRSKLMADALTLLKEQEAVEPTFRQDEDGVFAWACGSCGAYMYHIYDGIDKAKEYAKYCRQCGKKVKWE